MRHWFIVFCVLSSSLWGFSTHKPWFGDQNLFYLTPSYRFVRVGDYSFDPKLSDLNQHWLGLEVSLATREEWEFRAKGEVVQGSPWGVKPVSFGMGAAYLLLNDIQGDPVSLAANFDVFAMSSSFEDEPSTLFLDQLQAELSLSLGKEFSVGKYWKQRYYGVLGVANAKSFTPWLHAALGGEWNINSYIHLGGLLNGWYSTGNKQAEIDPFRGYGELKQRVLDAMVSVSWLRDYAGTFSTDFSWRLLGKQAAKKQLSLLLRYTFSFSL